MRSAILTRACMHVYACSTSTVLTAHAESVTPVTRVHDAGVRDFGGLPEQVEAELSPHSPAVCTASNRWGTMLAGAACAPVPCCTSRAFACAQDCVSRPRSNPLHLCVCAFWMLGQQLLRLHAVGCKNGDIVVYDMLTRGAACTLAFASLGQCGPAAVTHAVPQSVRACSSCLITAR